MSFGSDYADETTIYVDQAGVLATYWEVRLWLGEGERFMRPCLPTIRLFGAHSIMYLEMSDLGD